jgi:hypothetical protein
MSETYSESFMAPSLTVCKTFGQAKCLPFVGEQKASLLGMKPISDIRRQNLAFLVAQKGTQAAAASLLGKDKNQIYQWLLDPGTDGARNIGPRSARLIESKFEKPEGWLDHEQIAPSQSVGRDLTKMAAAVEWVRWAAEARGMPFSPAQEAELLEGVYALLARPEPTNLIELGDWLKQQGARDKSVGQDKVGSVDEDGFGGAGRKTG